MNYIHDYWKAIEAGEPVGSWIKEWYGIVEEGLANGEFLFDEGKAERAICFIENFCRHHEGKLAPGLIKLELWQKAFLSVVFGIVDEDGRRWFREVVLVVARKAGKTLLCAAIAAYCAFLDGEYGARVYFTAPKLDQANLCFDAFFQMVLQEPTLATMAQKRRSDVYIKESNSSVRPLSFSSKKSDGLNISLAVCDEIASWRGEAGLKFYEVLKSSVGSREQPLILSISTAGYEKDSIYDELIKRASRVILGGSEETRLAPFLYMVDDADKWDSIEEIRKANPNLGISVSEAYMEEEIRIAKGSYSKRTEFLTKYCCIPQNSSTAWLSTKAVDKCTGEPIHLEDFRGSYCVCGLDLSQTVDLTAATCLIERDDELYLFAHFWLPAERLEEAIERDGIPYRAYIARGFLSLSGENYVDYEDCYRWFTSLVEDYEILPLQTGYDRYSSQYLISAMEAYGFHCDDVFQGTNLYPIMMEVQGLIMDGRVHIGDNDLLKIHFLDSAIKMSNEQGRGKLVKVRNNCHIDGMASFLDAMTVRSKYYDEIGGQLQNREEN